jgi:hypothetical protein
MSFRMTDSPADGAYKARDATAGNDRLWIARIARQRLPVGELSARFGEPAADYTLKAVAGRSRRHSA